MECLNLIAKELYGFYMLPVFLYVDVQIENHKLYFRERAQSKCGSLDSADHIPAGGDKKVVCNLCMSNADVIGRKLLIWRNFFLLQWHFDFHDN